jgi:phage gp46-like protein
MFNCNPQLNARRKSFWTTQQCKTVDICGRDCGNFGIKYTTKQTDCAQGCDNTVQNGCAAPKERSLATDNFIKSLLINILMTDGQRPDDECGFAAGSRGGHWSNSYRANAQTIGSNIRSVKAGKTTAANVLALQVEAQKIANKIVSYGVVKSAIATVKYLGGMVYSLDIKYETFNNESSNVGFVGNSITAKSKSTFIWN